MFGRKKKNKDKDETEEKDDAAEDGGKGKKDDKADDKKDDKGDKDKPEGEEGKEGEGGEAGGEAPKKSKVKLLLAILVVVILAIAGGGLYYTGKLDNLFAKKQDDSDMLIGPDGKPILKPVYYTLPDFLVNLNSQGKAAAFLKAQIVIEVARQKDIPFVEANLPRISDTFTTYLRELRPTDLSGSAGIQRLREELLLRINKVLEPYKVNDVLFKEIVVQ